MKWLKVLLLFAVIVLAIGVIAIVYIMFSPQSSERVFYDFELTKSVYNFPDWNITLKANTDIPYKVYADQLYYGSQKVSEETWTQIKLNQGDSLTFNFKLNVHVASQENFTLYLWFEQNKYVEYELTLPEE